MRKPNSFIVGAPRCGTTALWTYLRSHPNVFMPSLKEPHFFSEDFSRHRKVRTMERYLDLFPTRSRKYLAMGEASVTYLLSKTAIGRIHDFNSEAKLIVMLRNPVDMIKSWHLLMVGQFYEDEADLGTAWRMQQDRRRGIRIPDGCREPAFLQYSEIGKVGAHVERVLSVFAREQVMFVVFDDFVRDASAVYESVLSFLDLPSDGREHFPRINENWEARLKWLGRFLLKPPAIVRRIEIAVKRALHVSQTGIVETLRRINSRPTAPAPLTPEFREELVEVFRPDVEKLSRILGRDLSGWE